MGHYARTSVNKTHCQYDDVAGECRTLMVAKNADYGDSWRLMRPTSFTDQLHVKVERILTLEKLALLNEQPQVSEGIESELRDIANYAIFEIIRIREERNSSGANH